MSGEFGLEGAREVHVEDWLECLMAITVLHRLI